MSEPPPPFDHGWHLVCGTQEGAGQVGVGQHVPLIERHFVNELVLTHHTGIVESDVESTKVLDRGVDEGFR